jgi:hypothetical protein
VEEIISVDNDKLYQRTDLLYRTEEQIISVYKIKEHIFKASLKPEPQPSTAGTCVSAALPSSPDIPDISSDSTMSLTLTQHTFILKAKLLFICK